MAAPSIAIDLLIDLSSFSYTDILSSSTAPSSDGYAFSNGAGLRVFIISSTLSAGTQYVWYLPFDSPNRDFTSKNFCLGIQHFFDSFVSVGIATSLTAYRTWPAPTELNVGASYYIDPTVGGTDAGAFDVTDVSGLVVVRGSAGDTYSGRNFLINNPYAFDKTEGNVLSGGDSGTKANFTYFYNSFVNQQLTTTLNPIVKGFNVDRISCFVCPHSITYSPAELAHDTNTIQFTGNQTGRTAAYRNLGKPRLTVNTGQASQIGSLNLIGGSNKFDFVEASAYANTYTIFVLDPDSLDLGLGNYSGEIRNPVGQVTGGGIINGLKIVNSSTSGAAYVADSTTDIESLAIHDSESDFAIDLSAKSGTLDLIGLTLSGNTFGTNIIRYASASNLTVTVAADSGIATGSGSSSFGDATVSGGGTLTIQVPVATTTFTGFPTANNSNGVAPAPVIGFYSSASSAGFIAGLDTSDPEYSAGSFEVLLSDYPGVTHIVGDAIGWIRTDYIPVDAGDPPSAVSLAAAFREIVSETGVALVGNGTVLGKAKLTYDQANTRFEVAAGAITFEDALDKKEELTSNVAGLEDFETAVVRGIQFISSKYGKEILLPSPLTIAAAAAAATSPILENFLVVRAGDPTADPFDHGLASTAPGLSDRPEIRMISTLFVTAESGPGGGGLGPEDIERLERIEQQLTADTIKGATRYQRLISGTSTVILDKDVLFDPETGFTLTEHQEPP